MTPETHTLWSGAISLVLFLVWQMYLQARRDVEALKTQNDKQETAIATLQANQVGHAASSDRLASAIDRLDAKIDALSQSILGRGSKHPPSR